MIEFVLNNERVETDASPGMVTLDLLRLEFGLTGTKEGCREGDCGACTVLLGEYINGVMRYRSMASCLLPVGELHGRHLVTIEGLNGEKLSAVQQSIVDEGATQCGFCTPGIVVALTGFLLASESLSEDDATAAIDGNICRCTGYVSIRRAVGRLVERFGNLPGGIDERVATLVDAGLLPKYFADIPARLGDIDPLSQVDGAEVVVAGGTDLFVQRADELADRKLEFISRDSALRQIRRDGDSLVVGAAATVESVMRSDEARAVLPGWHDILRLVSSTLIRNRATIAGNLVNASPIGDLAILLLALEATLQIEGARGSRSVRLDKFYRGYKNFDLAEGERIISITIPVPPDGAKFNFEKVARRRHLDIAGVNSAALLQADAEKITMARISAGGVAPVPCYLDESSAWLIGQPLSRATLDQLLRHVNNEVAPIDDVRGSADYKRRLLRRLVAAHFIECFPEYFQGEVV